MILSAFQIKNSRSNRRALEHSKKTMTPALKESARAAARKNAEEDSLLEEESSD